MTKTRKIGAVDAAILSELLKDGRKSFVEIAKECGTTKSVVWKRYREMKNAGIIVGSTVQLNYAGFGFYAVGTVTFQVERPVIDQALEYARKIPNIYGAFRTGKSYSIVVIATLRNMEELDRVRDTLKKVPSASGLVTNVWTGIRNVPENLSVLSPAERKLKDDALVEKARAFNSEREGKITEIDTRIVEQLSTDGRLSFKKIAEVINSSTNTVARRYDKLVRSGMIKVSIQISPAELGYHATAMFNIASVKNSILSIAEKIAKIPDVRLLLKITGKHDLSVTALIKDVDHLLAIQDEIACIDGVSIMETSIGRIPQVMPYSREYISTF